MNKIVQKTLGAGMLVAMSCGAWFASSRAMDLPLMTVDPFTGECIAVLSDNPDHTCSNPPERYSRSFGKPRSAVDPYREPPQDTRTDAERVRAAESDAYWRAHGAWVASIPADAEGKARTPPIALAPGPEIDHALLELPRRSPTTWTLADLYPAGDPAASAPQWVADLRPLGHHHRHRPEREADTGPLVRVPEPASVGLLLTGIVGLIIKRMCA